VQIPLILRGIIFFGAGRLLVEDVGWLEMGSMFALLFMESFLSWRRVDEQKGEHGPN